MMKTAVIASAVLFGAAAPTASLNDVPSVTAEQTMMNLPETDTVIAQFSYLELSHDKSGLSFTVTDKSDVFVDVEFAGDFHIRIGF